MIFGKFKAERFQIRLYKKGIESKLLDPVEMTVPAGPVAVEDVLPVLQGLSSLFAARATAQAAAEGRAVSCRAGCGACCRQ